MYNWYYLIYSLLFVGALGVILLLRPDLRTAVRPVFFLGALLGPLSEALFYYRDYWRPDTLLGPGRVSIEDVLFGASIYSLGVIIYAVVSRRGITTAGGHPPREALIRTARAVAVVIGLSVILNYGFNINSVPATAAALLLAWLVVALKRRELIIPSLVTGCVFAVVATAGYALALNLIAPGLLDAWWLVQGTEWGMVFLGNVPATEVLWFFAVGCATPALFMYATNRKFSLKRVPLRWRRTQPSTAPIDE